jgi:tRNA A-37 threonylcarbamoyl transferase component Bud32
LTSRCLTVDECLDHLDGRTNPDAVLQTHAHLDACRACCSMMAEAARGESASARRPKRAFLMLAVGDRVADRYEIRRFVARGGMGEVYEAHDSLLNERVALKTLVLSALDQEDAANRLIGEVRIARRVVHPNVCRILDVGFHRWRDAPDAPVPFLTMDYLAGETLAQRIARAGRLTPGQALPLLRDLATGLAAVHRAGIVHRDFKSENVFLVRSDDGVERAVVMDFGLASALERGASARRSSGRSVIGTVDYMAPEQVEGRELTATADIYAVGVVMFEMLAGQRPFCGTSAAAVALARLNREPPRISTLVPALAAAWDPIVERCLAREPGRRFARMEDLAASLDGLERPRPRQRHWLAAIALGAAAGMAITLGFARRPAPSAATVPRTVGAVAATPPAAAAPTVAAPPPAASAPARPNTPPPAAALRPRFDHQAAPARRAIPKRRDAVERPAPVSGREEGPEMTSATPEDLLADGKIKEACAAGEQAALQPSARPEIYKFLGRCYMRLGLPAKARANYQIYLERAGAVPDASFVRAILGSDGR